MVTIRPHNLDSGLRFNLPYLFLQWQIFTQPKTEDIGASCYWVSTLFFFFFLKK